MHALSSDEEGPTDMDPALRFDPKEIKKRLSKFTPNLQQKSEKRKLKKRVKKIIKKLKQEALQ